MERLNIAARIKKVIEDNPVDGKPLSTYKLERLGVISSSNLSNYLNGKTFPNKKVLQSFADYFRVSVDWLLTGQECENVSSESFSSDENKYLGIIDRLSRVIEKQSLEIERLQKLVDDAKSVTIASRAQNEILNSKIGTISGHPDILICPEKES